MTMEPELDAWVLTSDGRPLGRVKRTSAGVFLLDVPGAPDYWLSEDQVDSLGEETVRVVRMKFEADDLQQHRIKYGE